MYVCVCVRVRERVEMEGGDQPICVCVRVCVEKKGGEAGSVSAWWDVFVVCVYMSFLFVFFPFSVHLFRSSHLSTSSASWFFFPSLISPSSTSSKRTYAVSKKHPQPQTHRKKRNSRTPREENAEENRSIVYGFYTVLLFSFSFLLALGATYTYTQTK